MKRRVTIQVVYEDHGNDDPDWAYHLRMGDIDCDKATVIDPPVPVSVCPVCGQPGMHAGCQIRDRRV